MGASQTSSRARSPRKKTYTVPQLKKRAWKLLSELVRRSAANEYMMVNCYTCGIRGQFRWMQAGHAIPGRTGAVLLDEEIIRPQCYRCNVALRGNYPVFTTKLIQEKGMDWWETKLASAKQVKKWSRLDLLSRIEEYQAKIAALT